MSSDPVLDLQTVPRELDKTLWTAVDRLRANRTAVVYKHAVLGLNFLSYVPDSFAQRQQAIEAFRCNPRRDYLLDPADYGGAGNPNNAEDNHQELETRDYPQKNILWVPALSYWQTAQDNAKLPPDTEIETTNCKKTTYQITSTGRPLNHGRGAIGKGIPKLRGVLNKTYTHFQVDPANLSNLSDLIATSSLQRPDLLADFVMANPPSDIRERWADKRENDRRWKCGTPHTGNANFAWIQNMLQHLAPLGSMALLLANGSMSGRSGGENASAVPSSR